MIEDEVEAAATIDDGRPDPGGKAVIQGLLQPGEIQTMEVRTPANPNMSSSMLQFSHANGTIKTRNTNSFTGTIEKAPAPAKKK